MTRDIFQSTSGEEVVSVGPLRALRWRATDLQAPQTFLLIHGIWAGAHVWRRFGPYLAVHGYTTYAVWLRHHHPGADRSQLAGLGIQDYVDDIIAGVAELGAPVLVGHSLGGVVAQAVAAKAEPAGLGLLCSSAPRGMLTLSRLGLTLRAIPKFLGKPFRAGAMPMEFPYARDSAFHRLSDAEAQELLAHHVPAPRRVARQVAFWPPRVPRRHIHCPVLVAAGTDDRLIVPWVANRLAARYQVVPQLYPGRGHMIQLEPGWEVVADDLMRWADRFVA